MFQSAICKQYNCDASPTDTVTTALFGNVFPFFPPVLVSGLTMVGRVNSQIKQGQNLNDRLSNAISDQILPIEP